MDFIIWSIQIETFCWIKNKVTANETSQLKFKTLI